MTLLGIGANSPTEHDEAITETARQGMRAEILKRIALGGGWSVGAAIVFGAFEILRSNPTDAFPLLKSWGPWAIVSIVALYVVYDLMKTVLNIGTRLVHAVERLAVAQQKSADKDDRQVQEMQTLTSLTAQRSEKTYSMLQDHNSTIMAAMDRLEKKLDARNAGAEEKSGT